MSSLGGPNIKKCLKQNSGVLDTGLTWYLKYKVYPIVEWYIFESKLGLVFKWFQIN